MKSDTPSSTVGGQLHSSSGGLVASMNLVASTNTQSRLEVPLRKKFAVERPWCNMYQEETRLGVAMAILKSLGIKNLRSLKNIPPVPISPITVLIGRNSVGKSTFARIFPLIRQSVERRKKSPILWFGDYVDFGSLSQAVHRGEKEISFEFSIKLDSNDHVNEKKIDLISGLMRITSLIIL
ncbi:AAA family ATPase [Delftia sp.]|uniref:AAA family ATPase n=1 Tax=Delftia sp. TaxID=1886637 RepID=UPI00259D0E23|nr:AAA family ATPase [Delftia sp.]